MKNIFKVLLMLVISNSASAGTISYDIAGSITGVTGAGASNSSLLSQYAANYGVQVSAPVTFSVAIDPSRQGQITNADGSTTTLDNIRGDFEDRSYYFSSLASSSVDFSAFSTGSNSNNYAVTISQGRMAPIHFNGVYLGESLYLSATSAFCCGLGATNWPVGNPVSFRFDISDANGITTYSGNAILTPLPGALVLFGPALGGLLLTRIRRKTEKVFIKER